MKAEEIKVIILAILSFLLGCFQLAIWIGTPTPTDESTVLEIFWYLLQISVPIITSIICGFQASILTEINDNDQ